MLRSITWPDFILSISITLFLYWPIVFLMYYKQEILNFFKPGRSSDGNAGINQANTYVRGYFDSGVNLIYAIRMAQHKNSLDNRYLEVFVIGGNGITGNLKANCYNTEGYNVNPISGDFAPRNLVEKLNVNEIKKDYKALGAFINGPRRWCLDWINIPTGVERDFSGLKASWVATLLLKRGETNKIPYKIAHIERKSAFGINKGTTVFLLDDTDGHTFVMKSYSLVLDSTMTRDKVPAMLAKLKLPAGWKYRIKVLDKDMVLVPESGVATIVPDDLDNVYDMTGPGFSNYKP